MNNNRGITTTLFAPLPIMSSTASVRLGFASCRKHASTISHFPIARNISTILNKPSLPLLTLLPCASTTTPVFMLIINYVLSDTSLFSDAFFIDDNKFLASSGLLLKCTCVRSEEHTSELQSQFHLVC